MKKISQLFLLSIITFNTLGQFKSTVFPESQTRQKNASTSAQLRTTSMYTQSLDSMVTLTFKRIFTYNAEGNIIFDKAYERASVTEAWIQSSIDEYGYDAYGNVVLYLNTSIDVQTNAIVDSTRYEYTFDVNNNNTSETKSIWDAANGLWMNVNKIEHVFNSQGLLAESVEYNWATLSWMVDPLWQPFQRLNYTYDANDLLLDKTTYNSLGTIESVESYMYDSNGRKISKSVTTNYGTEGMIETQRSEYIYDGYLQTEVTYIWIANLDSWLPDYKYDLEIDIQENVTQSIIGEWDNGIDDWVYVHKGIYTYDLDVSSAELMEPFEVKEFSKSKVTGIYTYVQQNDNWELDDEYVFYYTNLTTTATKSNTSKTALLVYPNPASGNGTITFSSTTVTAAQLQLMDVQGNMVYNKSIEMNQPISMNGLKEGIYFYYVTDASAATFKGSIVINK